MEGKRYSILPFPGSKILDFRFLTRVLKRGLWVSVSGPFHRKTLLPMSERLVTEGTRRGNILSEYSLSPYNGTR